MSKVPLHSYDEDSDDERTFVSRRETRIKNKKEDRNMWSPPMKRK
ncbi:hypothetical protein PQC38_gp104 [Aeromonas phage BUCT695]|nr:hypothetical protein PQC38_gp104 [Aeromonas phage BUCT695]UIW10580.1 hypothetical protein [Aeromonas phage BUCT695]